MISYNIEHFGFSNVGIINASFISIITNKLKVNPNIGAKR